MCRIPQASHNHSPRNMMQLASLDVMPEHSSRFGHGVSHPGRDHYVTLGDGRMHCLHGLGDTNMPPVLFAPPTRTLLSLPSLRQDTLRQPLFLVPLSPSPSLPHNVATFDFTFPPPLEVLPRCTFTHQQPHGRCQRTTTVIYWRLPQYTRAWLERSGQTSGTYFQHLSHPERAHAAISQQPRAGAMRYDTTKASVRGRSQRNRYVTSMARNQCHANYLLDVSSTRGALLVGVNAAVSPTPMSSLV